MNSYDASLLSLNNSFRISSFFLHVWRSHKFHDVLGVLVHGWERLPSDWAALMT